MGKLYGAVEAGGTKFICAVGRGPNEIETVQIATITPTETLAQVIEFFKPYASTLTALGVGSFGPIDLNRESPTYGYITSTPKPGWAQTDILGVLREHFDVPIGFDTDVNAAALGEGVWGAAQGLDDYIYITIGTGIGGGVVSGGRLVHGLLHPELGHCFIPKRAGDDYKGRCPFHGDLCFEGLAAGPAIEERWQTPGVALPVDHPAWELEADYIAKALVTFIATLSPQKIILGGGVMAQSQVITQVREKVPAYLNGYIQHPAITDNIEQTIVLPGLGSQAGILGAMVLAQQVEC
ncbi:ROK family protein [Teredinibacter purpureus]|uniref:ROK family protein n=1 Tax=Teredinibacter purpureus TaxID=2731756 RepID=UPI0005F7AC43|nr:ROK family protein [Teredinibacter purpureus]